MLVEPALMGHLPEKCARKQRKGVAGAHKPPALVQRNQLVLVAASKADRLCEEVHEACALKLPKVVTNK